MAINPATTVMPTSSFPVNVAVQEVDINRAVPDPSVVSAQALVVVLDGGAPVATTGLTDAELRAAPVPVTPTQPIGGAYTDRSLALSGSSEQLMAANASRRVLVMQNVGATAAAVNLTGGAAALDTAGSVELAAGEKLVLDSYPPTGAITVIGTAAAAFTAYEG
jgi:hypothetical protein